jgi:energy-converting hydrogenase Eha subunit E
MIEVIGWIGAAIMVAASFNMARPLGLKMAIVGLSLLTIQAYSSDTYNLIVLNLSSIIGFTLSLIRASK